MARQLQACPERSEWMRCKVRSFKPRCSRLTAGDGLRFLDGCQASHQRELDLLIDTDTRQTVNSTSLLHVHLSIALQWEGAGQVGLGMLDVEGWGGGVRSGWWSCHRRAGAACERPRQRLCYALNERACTTRCGNSIVAKNSVGYR